MKPSPHQPSAYDQTPNPFAPNPEQSAHKRPTKATFADGDHTHPTPRDVAFLAATLLRNGNITEAVDTAVRIFQETATRYPKTKP